MTRSATPKVGILTGVTAGGKTGLALEYCLELKKKLGRDIEIINADSLLVYRGFDIGTAKPSKAELASVPHHLVDCVDARDEFTAGEFVRKTEAAIRDIQARGKRALIVGGTGFYLKALLFGLWDTGKADPELRRNLEAKTSEALYAELLGADPEAEGNISPHDRYRIIRALEIVLSSGKSAVALEREKEDATPNPNLELWFIDRERSDLRSRVKLRTEQMIKDGLLEETRRLLSLHGREARPLGSVGYLQTVRYLEGVLPEGRKISDGLTGLREEIELATLQLVKKQQKWFQSQLQSRGAGIRFLLDQDLPQLKARFSELYG